MPLHPWAQAHLAQPHMAARIPVETLSPHAARQQSRAMCRLAPPGEAVARTADFCIPGPHGGMIPVRMYTPAGMGPGPMPVCLYFHGGGWVLGDLDAQDAACRSMANGAACVVVSVNYRHAPEHPFPAAPEDCYAAACWVARQGAELGMDTQRLAVAGMSAGANLAIAVTLMAKERGGPSIACQALMVPVTDHRFDTRSYAECAEGYDLTLRGMQWYWGHYLAHPADGAHPWASPLRAADLSGLPGAFVMTSEYDPLRDEGEAYAQRLRDAGVPVLSRCNAGMMHGFLGPQAVPEVADFLRSRLHR